MSDKTVKLDVREDLRNGREPFSRIMNAIAALSPDQELLLVAPFEPVPLFGVLKQQGFQHNAQPLESGDWEVLFTRMPGAAKAGPPSQSPVKPPCPKSPTQPLAADVRRRTPEQKGLGNPTPHPRGCQSRAPSPNLIEVDARGLEPPQPMVRILESLAALPPGAELSARTDRRPLHLYAQLEERGFTAATEEQSDGSFLTHIRRR